MTIRPIVSASRVAAIIPALGVVPPSIRSSHSSTRCAPPRWAATADSTESRQTSSARPSDINGSDARQEEVLEEHGVLVEIGGILQLVVKPAIE